MYFVTNFFRFAHQVACLSSYIHMNKTEEVGAKWVFLITSYQKYISESSDLVCCENSSF